MGPHTATPILLTLIDGIILAILFGALASWVWTTRRLLREQPLLPETPIVERRRPPWGPGTILLILVAYILVSREAFHRYAMATEAGPPAGRAEAPARPNKGPEGPGPAKAAPKVGEGEPREPAAEPPGKPRDDGAPYGLSPLELMAIQGTINGVFILLLPVVARLTSRARLRDFGLSLRQVRRQVAVGVVAVLFLMPVVYSIQAACVHFIDLPDPEREKFKHPLEKMLRDSFSPGVAAVAFLTAVVLAPVFEELLFRGFLQSWLIKSFDRLADLFRPSPSKTTPPPPRAVEAIGSDALATSPLFDPDLDRVPAGSEPEIGFWQAAEESEPPTGESAPSPDDQKKGDAPYRPRSPVATGAAIILTSLIFAGLHATQWPAPIPLFVLAIGLGVVYQRTGSLLAPICMHAVFNGFSTLMLFHVALQPAAPGKPEARPVLEHVTPAEKVKGVSPDVGPTPQRGKT